MSRVAKLKKRRGLGKYQALRDPLWLRLLSRLSPAWPGAFLGGIVSVVVSSLT